MRIIDAGRKQIVAASTYDGLWATYGSFGVLAKQGSIYRELADGSGRLHTLHLPRTQAKAITGAGIKSFFSKVWKGIKSILPVAAKVVSAVAPQYGAIANSINQAINPGTGFRLGGGALKRLRSSYM